MRVLNVSERLSVEGGGVARRIREFAPHVADLGASIFFAGSEAATVSFPGIQRTYYCPELGGQKTNGEGVSLSEIVATDDVDIVHIHEVRSTDAYRSLVGHLPVAIHLQNYRMWCPSQDWFYKIQEEQCSLSVGWRCVMNAYRCRCNDRHPSALLRSLRECRKRRSLIQKGVTFIAGSNYMRVVAIEHGGIPESQVRVVSNAIDNTRFEEDGERPDVGAPIEPGFILYAGRIAESKGVTHLLDAYARLDEGRPKLVIAGDGYYRNVIEQHIHDFNLAGDVILAGWRSGSELIWLFKNCSVVVVPSVWAEVFGNVGLEAMAAKKPVIAYDVGGISEWLADGETGYLVPVKDADELSRRMAELTGNPLRAREMGKRGHARFLRRFTVQEQARQLYAVYRDMLNEA